MFAEKIAWEARNRMSQESNLTNCDVSHTMKAEDDDDGSPLVTKDTRPEVVDMVWL